MSVADYVLRARLWRLAELAVGLGHRVEIGEDNYGWPSKKTKVIGFDFYPNQNCDTPEFYDVRLGTKAMLSDELVPLSEHWLEALERDYDVRS